MGMVASRKSMSFLATQKPTTAELDPTPRLLVAPELVGREREHEVTRHDDDTEESYAARCELVNLILGTASKS